jgi:hypothetical protein
MARPTHGSSGYSSLSRGGGSAAGLLACSRDRLLVGSSVGSLVPSASCRPHDIIPVGLLVGFPAPSSPQRLACLSDRSSAPSCLTLVIGLPAVTLVPSAPLRLAGRIACRIARRLARSLPSSAACQPARRTDCFADRTLIYPRDCLSAAGLRTCRRVAPRLPRRRAGWLARRIAV